MENKILNEELNRISEIMGISSKKLINEQWDDLIVALERNLVDDAAKATIRNLADDLFQKLPVKLSNGAYIIKSVNPQSPILYLEDLLMLIDDVEKGVKTVDEVLDKIPRVTSNGQQMREPMKKILNFKQAKNARLARRGVGQQAGKKGQSQSGLWMPDPDPLKIPVADDIPKGEIEDIIARNMTNPRFQEWRAIVQKLNLPSDVEDLMLLAYGKCPSDPKSAIKYADDLSKTLNEQKYGFIKRGIRSAMKNPGKTITILGKTITQATFWYVCVAIAIGAGGFVMTWFNYGKKQLPTPPEKSGQPEQEDKQQPNSGLQPGEADNIGGQ